MDNEYYGIASTPMDDYLAHYGIRGMKWGVRKAIKSGNSARLGRQYDRAQKKLAKLEKAAANSGKYARRAARMGVGAGLAAGIAGVGPSKIVGKGTSLANRLLGGSAATKIARLEAGKNVINALNKQTSARGVISKGVMAANKNLGGNAATKIARLEAGKNAMNAIDTAGKKAAMNANKYLGGNAQTKIGRLDAASKGISRAGVSYDTIARVGAGVLGAGLAAGAARNAYKAATAKKKAERFRSEMNKAFAGTKYANGGKTRTSSKRRRRG